MTQNTRDKGKRKRGVAVDNIYIVMATSTLSNPSWEDGESGRWEGGRVIKALSPHLPQQQVTSTERSRNSSKSLFFRNRKILKKQNQRAEDFQAFASVLRVG